MILALNLDKKKNAILALIVRVLPNGFMRDEHVLSRILVWAKHIATVEKWLVYDASSQLVKVEGAHVAYETWHGVKYLLGEDQEAWIGYKGLG
jgi:hypothetical protein